MCSLPAAVVLCVVPGIAANTYCDDPLIDVGFIPATLIAGCELRCGDGVEYQYTFEVDSQYIASDRAILAKYITGVFCAGCLASWVEDRIGNEVTLEETGDGELTFTSQHGCQQTFTIQAGTGVVFFPGDTLYGDGSDGDRTVLAGAEELLPTLARNFYYENLTIDEGGILHPWGGIATDTSIDTNFLLRQFWPIFVSGTLTINGELNADGVSPPGLGYLSSQFGLVGLAVAGPGGACDSATYIRAIGLNGDYSPFDYTCEGCGFMAGGLGGKGGNGGSGGGTGLTKTIGQDAYPIKLSRLFREMTNYLGPDCLDNPIAGGSGGGGAGGGGGGTGAGRGASSGGGGGSIVIYARNIVVGPNGKITARGGNGCVGENASSGANRGGGGGGAGGGGGVIYMVYDTFVNSGTLDVSGGSGAVGGSGINGGTAGTAGTAGSDGNIYKLNRSTGLFE